MFYFKDAASSDNTQSSIYHPPSFCDLMVKNPPAMQEISVQSLGWENPLHKEMTTHSSILSWRIPSTEEPDWLQSMELQRVRQTEVTIYS